jgi:cellulose biosynthesis protein BcsQ
VITLTLFNNKGGVGKTTLAYHLAHMLARTGFRVLAVDLDPQSNLTAVFLDEDALEVLWRERDPMPSSVFSVQRKLFPRVGIPDDAGTIADSVRPLQEQTGDVEFFAPIPITSSLHLVPGDLALSGFEDKLSENWPKVFLGDPGALRVTSAFHRVIQAAGRRAAADVAIIDVGPNLGAINRAALLAADRVLMPLAADLFSLRGLSNLGPVLREWRANWQDLALPRAKGPIATDLPRGEMVPIGYVIMQPAMRLNRPVRAYERWLKRIPVVYSEAVLDKRETSSDDRSHEIATLRNYQSLMPLAHDARKPMFDLRPGDGAIGGTLDFVQRCYDDFRVLALEVATRLGMAGSALRSG